MGQKTRAPRGRGLGAWVMVVWLSACTTPHIVTSDLDGSSQERGMDAGDSPADAAPDTGSQTAAMGDSATPNLDGAAADLDAQADGDPDGQAEQGPDGGVPAGDAGVDASSPGPGRICVGDYTLTDDFEAAAVSDCTTIEGDLTVSEGEIVNLSLPRLTTLGGSLRLRSSTKLVSLSLTGLTSIGSSVELSNLSGLTTVSLPKLEQVIGSVIVARTGMLRSLSLPALASVGGLFAQDNPKLASLTLRALATVVNDLRIDSPGLTTLSLPLLSSVNLFGLAIHNTSLTALSLPALVSLGTESGALEIVGNSKLGSLTLPALTSVTTGSLTISGSPALTQLDLSKLTRTGNSLSIVGTKLSSLSLPALSSVGNSLTVQDSPQLQTVDLSLLERVETGDAIFKNNTALTSLNLPHLTDVRGDFRVTEVPLTTLSAPLLASVGEELELVGMYSVGTFQLSSLRSLGALRIVGGFQTFGLPSLTFIQDGAQLVVNSSVVDLGALRTIGGDVFWEFAELTDLRLPELTSVGGDFNPSGPTRIYAPKLVSVGGLTIARSDTLEVLALPALETIANDLAFGPGLLDPSLPALRRVGSLTLQNLAKDPSLPLLEQIEGDLRIDSPGPTNLNLPKLTAVRGLFITQVDEVSSVSLPALETIDTYLTVLANPKLATLHMPMLTTIRSGLNITANPMLPTSQAYAIRDQLVGPAITATIDGNMPDVP